MDACRAAAFSQPLPVSRADGVGHRGCQFEAAAACPQGSQACATTRCSVGRARLLFKCGTSIVRRFRFSELAGAHSAQTNLRPVRPGAPAALARAPDAPDAASAAVPILSDLRDKNVVVVGLARSGIAAALLASSRGANVTAVDIRESIEDEVREMLEGAGVRLELGPHKQETFTRASLIVASPGVPAAQPDLAAAIAEGVAVIGELAFAHLFLKHLPTVAITGTNGKSTVTWFTGQILSKAGRRPFVGGNIGNPLSKAVMELDKNSSLYDCLVVEVSSYQMELPGCFKPRVGVILNLTPDHLGRHGTMENYGAHKVRMFRQCERTDIAFLPVDDGMLQSLASSPGAIGSATYGVLGPFRPSESFESGSSSLSSAAQVMRDGNSVWVQLPTMNGPVHLSLAAAAASLIGEHNLDNAATAAALSLAVGAEPALVQDSLASLQALPHRLQKVGFDTSRDVTFINDSKATNVESTIVGITGIGTRQKSVVLLGGRAKEGPSSQFDPLVPYLELHGSAVVCFGEAGNMIADRLLERGLSIPLQRSVSLKDAVKDAANLAQAGEAVLLSPACASFDEFRDFEHRGECFTEGVREIVGS